MIIALAFYFVSVCNVDQGCPIPRPCSMIQAAWCGEHDPAGWPDELGAYHESGPFFTLEDCREERTAMPSRFNPWSAPGSSECYAREIRVMIDGSPTLR